LTGHGGDEPKLDLGEMGPHTQQQVGKITGESTPGLGAETCNELK